MNQGFSSIWHAFATHVVVGIIYVAIIALLVTCQVMLIGDEDRFSAMCKRIKAAVWGFPSALLTLLLSRVIAVGLVDPVQLELRRIERVRRSTLRDIERLRQQALACMQQIIDADGNGVDVDEDRP